MADHDNVSKITRQDGIALIEIDSPPVNALGLAVRSALDGALRQLLADTAVDAVVIACAGRTFVAGADITEFGKPLAPPMLNDIFALIDGAKKPVVAAIHGSALGGGFEFALACHYRIATPSAKVGLPEVSLGLLPGAGGTQRTPRLAGVAAALDLIVFGEPIGAAAAISAGLIDELAGEGALQADAIAFARRLADGNAPLRRARDLAPDVTGDEAARLFADFRQKHARMFSGFKAPANIVKAIEAATDRDFSAGLERETELFLELLASTESAAQRHLFFAERAAAKIPSLSPGAKPLPIKNVAVIGAGTMGRGIATAFLNAACAVTLIDSDPAALEGAALHIGKTIRSAAEKGRITAEQAERCVRLLTTAPNVSAIGEADLVIEAVFERLDLKQAIFAQMDTAAKPGAILASNTSFLDLNALAAATQRPESVVGLHFFAPANIMRLLEVVRGDKTSEAVLATAMGLGRLLGKVAVLSGVCDGFIANRLMARRGQAADRLILQGPMPWDIDKAMTGFGFPMGVYAMLDLVGLDVIGWDRENSAGRTVQEVLCESGRWGQKKNGGYYDYDDQRRASQSPVVEQVIRDFAERGGAEPRRYTEREIVELLLDPVVNEGAKLLEEGIALRASDIDIALVTGYGWPVFSGGPMFWGDQQGLKTIVGRLAERREAGEAIEISPLLEAMAADGRTFH